KYNNTFRPLKSARRTFLPSWSVRLKEGALSPASSTAPTLTAGSPRAAPVRRAQQPAAAGVVGGGEQASAGQWRNGQRPVGERRPIAQSRPRHPRVVGDEEAPHRCAPGTARPLRQIEVAGRVVPESLDVAAA